MNSMFIKAMQALRKAYSQIFQIEVLLKIAGLSIKMSKSNFKIKVAAKMKKWKC
jgi:hypothetical protein